MDVALCVQQPWAGLILLGFKTIENRKWPIPAKYKGARVYLHAGKAVALDVLEYRGEPLKAAAMRLAVNCGAGLMDFCNRLDATPDAFRMGGIIGAMDLLGCGLNESRSLWAFQRPDMWHWRIAAPTPLPFTPCRGGQRFFKPESVPTMPRRKAPNQADLLVSY